LSTEFLMAKTGRTVRKKFEARELLEVRGLAGITIKLSSTACSVGWWLVAGADLF
jgi:hypothetical protein